LKLVRVEEAVGKRLAFDYSMVTPNRKSPIKRRGDLVAPADVEELKRCGHYFVYVEDEGEEEGTLHEEEAVLKFSEAIAGENISIEGAPEGKAFLRAERSGLFYADTELLKKINESGVFLVIAKKHCSYVSKGDAVAIVDLIPPSIPADYIQHVSKEVLGGMKVLQVHVNRHPKVGAVITGTEIFEGRTEDLIAPILAEKLKKYEMQMGDVLYSRDDEFEIRDKILSLLRDHDAAIVTGGMSVDPTDRTPKAIAMAADEVVAYGIPFKPTTMSMVAYRGGKAILGVSSGIIYFRDYNVLDILLPWIAAQVRVPRGFIASLGDGGLSEYFLAKLKSGTPH